MDSSPSNAPPQDAGAGAPALPPPIAPGQKGARGLQPPGIPDLADDEGWRRLAPAARTTRMIASAITGTILAVPIAVLLVTILGGRLLLGLLVLPTAILVGAVLGAWFGMVRWRRTRWRLDQIGLHVRRGVIWHAEILVPRSRVQHLDLERGPLERQFGLATLVVHTAGTQTHALRQSGFDEADATILRDALIPDAARHVDAL